MKARPTLFGLLFIMACHGLITGCSWLRPEGEILMPVQATAAEQYRFAEEQRDSTSIRLVGNEDRLARIRARIRRGFEMLPENFPDDRRFTPLARLEVIEMDAGFDHPKVKPSRDTLQGCVRRFKELAEAYPEYEFVQAKALYGEGMCHRKLGEFKAAQEAFRSVKEKYINNSNDVIKSLAQRAASNYNEVYQHE